MALVVSVNTKEYERPQEGIVLGVLADIADLGYIDGPYGSKPKYRYSWVIDQKDSEGNYFVVSKTYTASLHEKSIMFQDIKEMKGAPPPVPYDVERLLGHVNLLVLKKETATTGKYAGKDFVNIKAFLKAPAGSKLAIPADYVREKDGGQFGRKKNNNQNQQSRTAPAQQSAPAPEVADEDIPF